MNIINKRIEDIKPYKHNPRKNEEAAPYVANSIKEFGFKVPIVIDKEGIIVTGHTRYKAAKSLGLTEVPCIVADDLTDDQIKAYRIADNKVSELAEWDYGLLKTEFEDIIDVSDMKDFGFEDFEISIILNEKPETEDEEEKSTSKCKKSNRVIINYMDADAEFIRNLLGLEEGSVINKIYNISAIVKED